MRIILLASDRTAVIRDIGQIHPDEQIPINIYPESDGVLSVGNRNIPFKRGFTTISPDKLSEGENKIELRIGNAFYKCTSVIRSGMTVKAAYDASELAVRDAIEIQRLWDKLCALQGEVEKLKTKNGINIIK